MAMLLRKNLTSLNVTSLNYVLRPYSEVVNVFGRKQVDTKPEPADKAVAPATIPESAERIGELTGHPSEQLVTRLARVFVPAKNSMQSGTFGMRRWKIQFETRERWENPNMGWSSSGDPLSGVELEFKSQQDAELYCKRMGYTYRVDEPHFLKKRIKSYGANFSWDKKTRRTAK